MVESKWKQKKEASAMETIFYHVDAKQITCQASEDRKASGAAGEVRCVVVPRKLDKNFLPLLQGIGN